MTSTSVDIERNDGSETFVLKTSRIDHEISNGLVTDSIISGVSRELGGGKLVLDIRKFEIDIDIQGMEAADYPNSSTYSDDDYGYAQELERAALTWGWTSSDGFDTLNYDGRTLTGVLTNLNLVENTENTKARQYTGNIEWTYLDVFVGD